VFETATSQRRAQLATARLYLVCDAAPGGRELSSVLRAAIPAGVDIVQLRDKQRSDEELAVVAGEASALCVRLGALLIVNDRPHVALAAGADGVHVGQDDLSVAGVRELVGAELLIGLSTHTPEQILAAEGADYLGVGPVHATPTKPGRVPVGLELVRHASRSASAPWFAIGGINSANVAAVLEAGARRVAVVRAIADAADPGAAAGELRSEIDRHPLRSSDGSD
jgi:thiamine-phosphate pyrophosphorylase